MRTLLIAAIAALSAALLLAAACRDALPQAPPPPAAGELSELDRAAAKLEEWLDHLRTVQLELSVVTNINAENEDRMARISATAMITDDQFYFSAYLRNRETPDEPGAHFETLAMGDSSYSRWYDVDGWLHSPLTDSRRSTAGSITLSQFIIPSQIITPSQIGSGRWAELENVSIARADQAGRAVWLVDYTADRAELARFPGLVRAFTTGIIGVSVAGDRDPLSATARLWIDRESGALLRIEITQQLNLYGSGQDYAIASTIELVAWNSPLEIPAPEPLVDAAEYAALLDSSLSSNAPNTNTAKILHRTRNDWFTDGREAKVRQRATVTLNGDERRVSSDTTITAGEEALPLSLFELSGPSWVGSSGGSGAQVTMLWLSLSQTEIEDYQDLLLTILQTQLDGLLEAPPTVERVLYFDLNACFEPDTGQLFSGEIEAAALTSAGQLELETTVKIGPASAYVSCDRWD